MENTDWKKLYLELKDQTEQELGKALGFPWYKDDQKNFPGATKENGVCVGHYVVEDIVKIAAERIRKCEGR